MWRGRQSGLNDLCDSCGDLYTLPQASVWGLYLHHHLVCFRPSAGWMFSGVWSSYLSAEGLGSMFCPFIWPNSRIIVCTFKCIVVAACLRESDEYRNADIFNPEEKSSGDKTTFTENSCSVGRNWIIHFWGFIKLLSTALYKSFHLVMLLL